MGPYILLFLIAAIVFSCSHCRFKHPERVMFVKHTRNHADMPDLSITCPFCGKCFRVIRHFNDHVKKCPSSPSRPVFDTNAGTNLVETSSTARAMECETGASAASYSFCNPDKAVAGLLGKLRYEMNVPATVCTTIADGMHRIIANISDGEGTMEVTRRRQLETLKACKRYRSSHKLSRFIHHHNGTIHPLAVTLSRLNEPKHTMRYVSVKTQLKRLLFLGLLTNVLIPRADCGAPNMTYQDIWDGSCHNVLSGEKVLSLLLYYDDFTVTNPLGSRNKKGKLGVVYFTICNFSTSSRSKTRNIYLALMFRSSYVKKYGWAKILEPLVKDLIDLEKHGLGEGVAVRLGAVVADNLAAHAIAGLSESFSSSACRFCLMSRSDMKSSTALSGNSDIGELFVRERSKFERNEPSVFKRLSPLTQLISYDILRCHPPDIAHDIFEGTGPLTISLVLTTICLHKKVVALETINKVIKSFSYERVDRTNQPRILSVKGNRVVVKQSMSECWTLLRLLPLMIGHLVPNCSEWAILVLYIRILELIVAPSIMESELVLLRSLIESFLRRAVSIFGQDITPKMHFMLHYPDEIRKHGPLRMLWTLRFEQKHQILKRFLESSRCRKNVCASIASKHEYSMARHRSMPGYLQDADEFVVLSARAGVIRKVRCAGQIYAVGDALFVRRGANVQCGVLECIKGKGNLVVDLLEKVGYDTIRNVYKIKRTGESVDVNTTALATYHPAAVYGEYVVLMHSVSGFNYMDAES